MSKINEFFGLNCSDSSLNFEHAMKSQLCPYTKKICTKMRKSNPEIKIGTCSVKYKGQNIIICPFRMLEHNQVFIDCLHLLTLHEPGNELYLVPEVKIPGGYIDYFLISAKNRKVKDFVGIEIQTMDTIGTVWPERQKFLNGCGIKVDESDLISRKTFGINWKMTMKTILIQMHHKSETFEHLNKKLVLIIQSPLYEHMKSDFDFKDIHGVRIDDPVHIHSYSFEQNEKGPVLSLDTRISTNSTGIANCLGLRSEKKFEMHDLILTLEPKLLESNRLDII